MDDVKAMRIVEGIGDLDVATPGLELEFEGKKLVL